jgi:competence protein ComEC
MIFFKSNPFIRLLLPFITGIIIQYYLNFNYIYFLFIVIIFTTLLIIISVVTVSYKLRFAKGLLITLIFTGFGITVTGIKHSTVLCNNNETIFTGTVTKIPIDKGKYLKTEINITKYTNANNTYTDNFTIIAYFEKCSSSLTIKAGSTIKFKSELQNIPKQLNPFGFDYSKYLLKKDITYTAFIQKDKWKKLLKHDGNIKYFALNLRKETINIFENNNIKKENLAILSALTIGYKDNLDYNTKQEYSKAGAMHVLAVSGLHVGIIFLIVSFLFKWAERFKRLKYTKPAFTILVIWGYALITGLSPSVVRASTMFTFILVGMLLNRQINIYNSIAASAFFILIFNPLLLFDMGFQLSYIAVIGIVFFYKKIYGLLYFKYKFFSWLWALTSVSIAAQLSTFPITVYYFHQFSNLFWLSNIIVSVSATILIILTILLIIFSSLPVLANALSYIINVILHFNIVFIHKISNLPFSVIDNLNLTLLKVILFYLIILCIYLWITGKKTPPLTIALLSILIIGISNIYNIHKTISRKIICVYQIKNATAIQFIDGELSIWFTSNSDNAFFKKLIKDADIFWNIKSSNKYILQNTNDTLIKNGYLCYNSGFWKFYNYTGFILNSYSRLPIYKSEKLNLNYLIITGNPPYKLADIPKNITYKNIIIDGSVFAWKVKQYKKNKNTRIFYTKTDGAFIKHIPTK